MNIWTKDNIINYTSDPDEANDKKYPKELQIARKALREEDQALDREYINRQQSVQMLADAYNYWNDNFVGSKATRIQETRKILKNAGSDKYCLMDLEAYVKQIVYPEL